MPRDGRMGLADVACGAAHRPRTRNGQKDAQVIPIQTGHFSNHPVLKLDNIMTELDRLAIAAQQKKKAIPMTYEITLLEADIRDPMNGNMVLGLEHQGVQQARLEYNWDASHFATVFRGHAPSLPVPAHPTTLLQQPIIALYKLKTDAHPLITDVFKDHKVSFDPRSMGEDA